MSKAIPARVEYNKMGICWIPKFRSDGVKLMAFLESPHQIDTKILKKINAPKCSLTSVMLLFIHFINVRIWYYSNLLLTIVTLIIQNPKSTHKNMQKNNLL